MLLQRGIYMWRGRIKLWLKKIYRIIRILEIPKVKEKKKIMSDSEQHQQASMIGKLFLRKVENPIALAFGTWWSFKSSIFTYMGAHPLSPIAHNH